MPHHCHVMPSHAITDSLLHDCVKALEERDEMEAAVEQAVELQRLLETLLEDQRAAKQEALNMILELEEQLASPPPTHWSPHAE